MSLSASLGMPSSKMAHSFQSGFYCPVMNTSTIKEGTVGNRRGRVSEHIERENEEKHSTKPKHTGCNVT